MTSLACPVAGQPFLLIHTDGSCLGNPGPGGWAAVLRRIDASSKVEKRKPFSGGEVHTTNNRMELTAAIMGLRALKRSQLPVVVVSDSNYVRSGITEWLPGWKAKGWKTSTRQPVKNCVYGWSLRRSPRHSGSIGAGRKAMLGTNGTRKPTGWHGGRQKRNDGRLYQRAASFTRPLRVLKHQSAGVLHLALRLAPD